MSNHPPELTVTIQPGADAILKAVAEGHFSPMDHYRLRLEAERLQLATGFDELICLSSLSFTPLPYQLRAAQAALRRFRGRGLLCDEVGLGKTIEAGLVLKEYVARQMAQRVLILTPPGLVEQWREELAAKFGLHDFVTNYDDEFRRLGKDAWAAFPRVIASLAAARLRDHRRVIADLSYDLIVVDEAHHLKNRASVSWKFVDSLQKKYILLLTATPVENKLDELYNLITILKPGQLKTPQAFRREFVVKGDPRSPKNRGRLRDLLADVMIRHSRGQVSVKLPPRRAHTVRLTLSEPEQDLYRDVSAFVRQLYQDEAGGARRLALDTLQRQIGSSPVAALQTLTNLAKHANWKPHRGVLRTLAEQAAAASQWAKADALQKLVQTAGQEKLIIFTHFRATLDALAARLRDMEVDFAPYHGGLTTAQKDAAIRHFETDGQVLLSTEAAGEGRNLQFCHVMINFDLPWNPQRIEQRVGRIHRVGQSQRVDIFNLAATGTIEDYLLSILDEKLNMFELVIGEVEMILGHLTQEQDFEAMLLEVWLQHAEADHVQAGMEQLGDKLVAARDALRQIEAYDEALFGEDFAAV